MTKTKKIYKYNTERKIEKSRLHYRWHEENAKVSTKYISRQDLSARDLVIYKGEYKKDNLVT